MRHLKNWLRAYVEYTSNLEAPDKFHFWAGVSTLAGALQGKVWIDMGYFKWKPNFFIIFVAPPGVVGKSTTVGVGYELLRAVPDIKFGPDSCTWQGITDALQESSVGVDLGSGDKLKMSSISIAASELGTFLDPRNRELIDFLVDLWDGRTVPWKRRTKGEGESLIDNPWINIIGCTTPSWIAENFPEYAIGGGFASRTLFIYGETKRHLIAYPHKASGAAELMQLKPLLIEDLQEIATMVGEFHLTPEAYKWGVKWYEDHWLDTPEHLRDEKMGGYVARKQTHIHKLAMIISAAQRPTMTITAEDLDSARDLVESLEKDTPLVFQQINDNRDAKYAAAVLLTLRKMGRCPKRELWKRLFNTMSMQEFDMALNGIIAAGYAKLVQYGSDSLFIEPLDTPPTHRDPVVDTSSQLGYSSREVLSAPSAPSKNL